MGELIQLSERRADRTRESGRPVRFFFALDDPLSYLAAERIERALGVIEWVPVLGPLSERDAAMSAGRRELLSAERMRTAEREAVMLGLPLVEPHRLPMNSRRAARAALFAAGAGAVAPFALALMRLAFCGGFDIGSAAVLEEAAAVAGLDPALVVPASVDPGLDLQLDATSRCIRARGVASSPAISIAGTWFQGTTAVAAAATFTAARDLALAPQLPAG